MSGLILFPCHHANWGGVKSKLQRALDADTLDEVFEHLSAVYKMKKYVGCSSRTRSMTSPYMELRGFLEEEGEEAEAMFHKEILPTVIRLAMECESLLPDPPLSVIGTQSDQTICLSRHLVASIIACGFLCFFDDRDEEDMPYFNFSELWASGCESTNAKFRMLLNYFRRLSAGVPEGDVMFRRLVLSEDELISREQLVDSTQDLCALVVKENGKMEDAGRNVLQVDFANAYLGGGVLEDGNVQEEIRFCICPELLASMLLMERMEKNEAVIMEGCEQFSSYTGYGRGLGFDGDYKDDASRSDDGQILTAVTAIDACDYRDVNHRSQYTLEDVLRDLNKAYVGFYQPHLPGHGQPPETSDPNWVFNLDPKKKRAVATGNWGCGVFGGDPQLKSVLQWLAASTAKCPAVIYYTFADPRVRDLVEIVELVQRLHWKVGDLAAAVFSYCADKARKRQGVNLFDFLLQNYGSSLQSDNEKETKESPKNEMEEMS